MIEGRKGTGWGDTLLVKCLSCKYKNLSYQLSITPQKSQLFCICNPRAMVVVEGGSGTPAHGMVLPTFRSRNSFPDVPVKLAVNISHPGQDSVQCVRAAGTF